jgi:hypothetical protein
MDLHIAGRHAIVCAACAYLCSVQASYIVGQNLLVDDGTFPGTL